MKKPLLLLITLLTTILTSFGQVPANNLLENATLINSFPFSDNNVRLDLATASSISPSGCPVGNYNLVYYKFTAAESSQFEVTIEDANDNAVSSSFAIVFSAPSLNITDETELTIVSGCGFSSYTSITTVEGNSYFVLVNRSDASELSNITFQQETIEPVPTSERDALIALYNSTNGDGWSTNTNWNSVNPVGTWYGVTTTNIDGVTHVTQLNLGGNNLSGPLTSDIGDFPELTNLLLYSNQLTGNVPPEIGNLTKLVEMDLSPNSFSGTIPVEIGNLVNLEILWLNHNGLTGSIPSSFENLINLRELYLVGAVDSGSEWSSSSYSGDFPDLTAAPLEILRIQDNFFTFENIADEYDTYVANIPDFQFNPQYTLDPPEDIDSEIGENITLTITDIPGTSRNSINRMSGNNYEWFKDDVAIADTNATSYTVTNAQGPDSGIYYCEITNPDLPGYVVRRSDITLDIGGYLSIDNVVSEGITIYPNPVTDYIIIKMNNVNSSSKATVYDLSGRLILTKAINSKTSKIPTNTLQSGIYLLTLENGPDSITKQIMKK